MELLRSILDYLVIPVVLWNIYLTLRVFDMKSTQSVLNNELVHLKEKQKDQSHTTQKLEEDLKREFKSMNEKIDEMPQKIVDFIKSTRVMQ